MYEVDQKVTLSYNFATNCAKMVSMKLVLSHLSLTHMKYNILNYY